MKLVVGSLVLFGLIAVSTVGSAEAFPSQKFGTKEPVANHESQVQSPMDIQDSILTDNKPDINEDPEWEDKPQVVGC